jgi:hypothetical protein
MIGAEASVEAHAAHQDSTSPDLSVDEMFHRWCDSEDELLHGIRA